jgi:hypothetical protein
MKDANLSGFSRWIGLKRAFAALCPVVLCIQNDPKHISQSVEF